jgi:hypothetical protein
MNWTKFAYGQVKRWFAGKIRQESFFNTIFDASSVGK